MPEGHTLHRLALALEEAFAGTRPRASSPQGRSWFAVWSGDPPSPPSLPPDQVLLQVDAFQPGNWMTRLVETRQTQAAAIPGVGSVGALMLILVFAMAGWLSLRRSFVP